MFGFKGFSQQIPNTDSELNETLKVQFDLL